MSSFFTIDQTSNSSIKKRYLCQCKNESGLKNLKLKAFSSKRKVHNVENLISNDLKLLKREIKIKHKILILELKKLAPNIWPMSKTAILVNELVNLRQNYLAKLSLTCGYNSKITKSEILNFLTQKDMIIFAIDSVLRSKGSKSPGIDNIILTKENTGQFLELLTHKKLKKYKSSPVKIVTTSKIGEQKERKIGIPTIYDRLVQKLFLLVLDPVIDVHSDKRSFGFRKGRNFHQAVGIVSSILSKNSTERYTVYDKYILKFDIKNFFANISEEWLLENYPMPDKFKFILKQWLNYETLLTFDSSIQSTVNEEFAQKCLIGPSIINFTLDGLENECKPSQKTIANEKKMGNFKLSK